MRFLLLIGVLAVVLGIQAPAASAATPGLAYTEDTVFTVGETSVDVVTQAVMTNITQERRSGNTIFYSYFDTFVIVVPSEAENLSIVSQGQPLSSTRADIDEDFTVREALMPSELRPGQSRSFTVTYSLPAGEIRGDGLFLSNPAFHSFPLWSFSDPGIGSLLLRVPEDAEVTEFGGSLKRLGLNDGFVEWEPHSFEVPEDFFTYVTVAVDDQLKVDTFAVSGQKIELRTWPGDEVWERFAREAIVEGLPELERQIGLPIPDQETLEVTESAAPYLHGYGGWYDQADTSIVVGNEIDRTVMIHELSHAWFNNSMFDERWIIEGLAEEFTWQTQNGLGWPTETDPLTPNTEAPNAVPVSEWRTGILGGVDDTDFREREEYGYTTSWFVIREMVDIVGIDAMREVLAKADSETMAYLETVDWQRSQAPANWKRLLDLASAGATPEQEAELDRLFIDYVVGAADLDRIDERRSTRDRYLDFVAGHEAGWQVPTDIRTAMELWWFDQANGLMGAADEVHERFRQVNDRAVVAGLELSDASQTSYERNGPDFALALGVLDEQDAAIDKVEAIRRRAYRPRTTEERWGLRGISVEPIVDHAEAAFAADDDRAIADAREALDAVFAAAVDNGQERLLWSKIGGGAGAGIVLIGLFMLVRRSRRGRGDFDIDLEELDDPDWASEDLPLAA